MTEEQCWTCVYGLHLHGIQCTNKYVNGMREKNKPDKYACEFYDEVTDDYMSDMEKVRDNT